MSPSGTSLITMTYPVRYGGADLAYVEFNPDDLVIWNAEAEKISNEHMRLEKLSEEERALEIENNDRSERFKLLDL